MWGLVSREIPQFYFIKSCDLIMSSTSAFELSLKRSDLLKKSFLKFMGSLNIFTTKSLPGRLVRTTSPFTNIDKRNSLTNFKWRCWYCRMPDSQRRLTTVPASIFLRTSSPSDCLKSLNLQQFQSFWIPVY